MAPYCAYPVTDMQSPRSDVTICNERFFHAGGDVVTANSAIGYIMSC